MMSILTFCLYGVDKLKAKKGWRRVPEATLHLFELAFGWPGAWVAQQVFRHKTIKKSFRGFFWLMVAANLMIVACVVSLFK